MRVTNPNIRKLKPNEVFVFGSNLAGIHGAGAARLAYDNFGAVWGEGEGLRGQSYALPTKDDKLQTLPLIDVQTGVEIFSDCVEMYPEYDFLITEVGCGLAGFSPKEIAPLFNNFVHLENITMPFRFWQVLLQEEM